eukprot:TRINITY_DN4206_c0_g1_i1.p1 TRINITY_DN4206_c0_g1~~TRINITY_DN4206_c0_g1_i1.p1  ORF type:complete len:645 (+),score=185.99 TRINITY_DN4206_c0_g1_i1:1315-3249(+)
MVCTIEKASVIVNTMIEENRMNEIGCVIVDELHMIAENDRGHILELLLTKILSCGIKSQHQVQIIGMSATVPNVTDIAQWMNAAYYISDFRPVPLVESFKWKNHLYNSKGEVVRELTKMKNDSEDLYQLVEEVIKENNSVLVFCGTKKETQETATCLCQFFPSTTLEDKKEDKLLLLQNLRFANSGGIDPVLRKSIPYGVAFHNSSLTTEERELIEEAYHKRIINVLTSTSTLAAGVNLPARRVILKSINIGFRETLNTRQYKQMCGRAGRAGIDNHGESILILKPNIKDKEAGIKLMNSDFAPLRSCLHKEEGGRGFKRLILDAIAGKFAETEEEIQEFIKFTLMAHQVDEKILEKDSKMAISFLLEKGFIQQVQNPSQHFKLKTTILGDATFKSSFSPEEALIVKEEVLRAMDNVVLSDDIHLCYLITPIFNLANVPSWEKYSRLVDQLSQKRQKIAEMIGIDSGYLIQQAMTGVSVKSNSPMGRACHRFYYTLQLVDLINEVPLDTVAERFDSNRGALQTLMQSSQSFAIQVSNFCKVMDYWSISMLLSQYVQRLNFGVKQEILPLTEIRGVKKGRARVLWNAGFHTVRQIALADVKELSKVKNLGPFPERTAGSIIRQARELLERKAQELRETADEMLNL